MAEHSPSLPPFTTQWAEARGNQRLYDQHPYNQARFVASLLGFRQILIEFREPSVSEIITISGINTVTRGFVEHFPDFMRFPETDPHLIELVKEIQAR
jgi:hypothetical protein